MKRYAMVLTVCALYCGVAAFAADMPQTRMQQAGDGKTAVEIEREQMMMKILKKPPVPIKSQDKVVRVLFLPYVDTNGVLHNYKYSFLSVEEGRWVLGDYLMKPAELDRRVLKPLASPLPASARPKPEELQRADKDQPRKQTGPTSQPEERIFETHDEGGAQ